MTTIRRINTSQVDGNGADANNETEIRPYGEIGLYINDNDKLELLISDGIRTHFKSKVLSKGTFYGGDADSADGNGYDTIKLIPDVDRVQNNGSDQYIIIDPTVPNHIHIRAGGTIDNSNAELILGGEVSNVSVGAGEDPGVYVKSNNNNWIFDVDGGLVFPDGSKTFTASIESDSVIICKAGDNLATKYTAAKLLTPGGNALSGTNRATLIIMPGNYSLSADLTIDGEYIDIIGLGSSKLDRGCVCSVFINDYTLNVTANNVRIVGISVGSQAFLMSNDLYFAIIENCIGGNNSYSSSSVGSTFINCAGGDYSFGGILSTAYGTFTNCVSGNSSFSLFYHATGYFKNCQAGDNSFGGYGGTATGTFIDCTAGDYSFAGNSSFSTGATGYFENCTGGNYSFAGGDSAGSSSQAAGYFKNCTGGNYSFGGGQCGSKANGTFIDCIGNNGSFGGDTGITNGIFMKCILNSGTFNSISDAGTIRLCIDGNLDAINQGPTEGIPGQPTNLIDYGGEGLTWTAPDDGGYPIIGYKIYLDEIEQPIQTCPGDTGGFIDTTTWRGCGGGNWKVSAYNSIGEGRKSQSVYAILN